MCYSHLWNWMQVLWSCWSHYSREGVGEGLGVSWLQKVIRLDILSNAAHKTHQTPAIFNILGTGIPLWYRYLIYNSAFLTSPMFLLFGFIYPRNLNNIFLNLKIFWWKSLTLVLFICILPWGFWKMNFSEICWKQYQKDKKYCYEIEGRYIYNI